MYTSLNDLTTLVGFTDEQRDQLRRAIGEERQALFDRPFSFTLRELAWISRSVWPQFSRVIEGEVAFAITERGMTPEEATAWGMQSHVALATLIRRAAAVIERELQTLNGLGFLDAHAEPMPPETPQAPPLTDIRVEGNVIQLQARR